MRMLGHRACEVLSLATALRHALCMQPCSCGLSWANHLNGEGRVAVNTFDARGRV
jgi:hypothetical protein